MLRQLRHFPDFVKLSHSVFALPFALASMLLAAHGFPSWRIVFLIIGAVVTARFAAMAFNRIVDRHFDAKNPRTAGRHLPTGKMSIAVAWMIVVVSSGLFVWISICINSLAAWLSPVALIIVLGYSLTKRFTHFSHFFLGTALGLAPVGAWIAVTNDFHSYAPFVIALAVMCWVAGFDMIYAMQDEVFDRSEGLHSMVVKLGPVKTLWFVKILHLVMLILLLSVGSILHLPKAYFWGLLIVLAGLVWEQWLMQTPSEKRLGTAFLGANAAASFGYLVAVVFAVF